MWETQKNTIFQVFESHNGENKLAKARKMRKPAGTLGLKKFGPVSFGSKKFGPKILLLIFLLKFYFFLKCFLQTDWNDGLAASALVKSKGGPVPGFRQISEKPENW